MENRKLIFWRGKTFDPRSIRELGDFHRTYRKFSTKNLDDEEKYHMLQNFYKLDAERRYIPENYSNYSQEAVIKAKKKEQKFYKNLINDMDQYERSKLFEKDVAYQQHIPLETLLERFKPSIQSEREKYKPRTNLSKPSVIHYVEPEDLETDTSSEEE